MVAAITIKERRSIRKYNETPVAQELVISLLKEAASLYEAEGRHLAGAASITGQKHPASGLLRAWSLK